MDILYLWAPLIGVAVLMVLLVFLHNWVLVLHVVKSLRMKMNPQPFTRIGSRVVLGLLDSSHGDHSGGSSTLSKGSTLVSYVYPRCDVEIMYNINIEIDQNIITPRAQ